VLILSPTAGSSIRRQPIDLPVLCQYPLREYPGQGVASMYDDSDVDDVKLFAKRLCLALRRPSVNWNLLSEPDRDGEPATRATVHV
jgi:hypothetical protein